MSGASFRKIGFFRPGRLLAAPEGPKIAGGASLARRRKARIIPGHPLVGGLSDYLGGHRPRRQKHLCIQTMLR